MRSILSILLITLLGVALCNAQSSKSCGSCHAKVSASSKVGDYCPYCGVRWGYENETRTQRSSPTYTYPSDTKYPNYYGTSKIGVIRDNANVRSGPSKSYPVEYVLHFGDTVTIIERVGDWYYLSYFDFFNYSNSYGYVHKSLISFY